MYTKTIEVDGATQFAETIVPPSRLASRQVSEIPRLGIFCPSGGIGDLEVFWEHPTNPDYRVPIATVTQAQALDPDGKAIVGLCAGVAPISQRIAGDGVKTVMTWNLRIVSLASTAKVNSAYISYSVQISPAPNEVDA